jgi:hypothetical protein
MAKTVYLYEMEGGACFGYFSGKYLYSMGGECTHYRGSDEKYLYRMQGGQCDFYQKGKYFYEMNGGKCRWYLTQKP